MSAERDAALVQAAGRGLAERERPASEHAAPLRNLAWLVRLRWFAVASQALTILVSERLLHIPLSSARLYAIVGVTAASNVLCMLWLRRMASVREGSLAALMALDFILLTALLHSAGGPSNPFTVLYLVHIALAAVVLKPSYTWSLAALSSACFGALFALPGAGLSPGEMHMHHGGAHQAAMSLHLQGMWVAFAVAAFVIAYFVTRVTRDLELQRQEAALAQARALRSEKLASLATLAAGAAHELATPLATIAVVAKELERELSVSTLAVEARANAGERTTVEARANAGERTTVEARANAGERTSVKARAGADERNGRAADARLIRAEVERCKHILSNMASDAGESAGEAFSKVSLRELVAQSLEGLSEPERVELELATEAELKVPTTVLARALRGLLRNALQASTAAVTLRAEQVGEQIAIEVRDQGVGMSAELLAKVGEPFFTTKPAGQGMGLGVFLARALCERLGGRFELWSKPGEGTRARVVLPQGEPAYAK